MITNFNTVTTQKLATFDRDQARLCLLPNHPSR